MVNQLPRGPLALLALAKASALGVPLAEVYRANPGMLTKVVSQERDFRKAAVGGTSLINAIAVLESLATDGDLPPDDQRAVESMISSLRSINGMNSSSKSVGLADAIAELKKALGEEAEKLRFSQ